MKQIRGIVILLHFFTGFIILQSLFSYCSGQVLIPLYSGKIPNSKIAKNEEKKLPNREVDSIVIKVSIPELIAFFPQKSVACGTAVIICPGGGYDMLLIKREGSDIARAFNRLGVAAFVLKYRLPSNRIMENKSLGPIEDAQRAIQIVRQRANSWGIDKDKIGIMGFSAGGHLAALAGTHFDHNFIINERHINLRPDFMLLIYPLISLTDSLGNSVCRQNLLGKSPSKKEVYFFSNEFWVTPKTPTTLLIQAVEDKVVSSKNSLYFYEALKKNSVSVGLHLYDKGDHGFLTDPPFTEWFGRCVYWMRSHELIR